VVAHAIRLASGAEGDDADKEGPLSRNRRGSGRVGGVGWLGRKVKREG
jgi:hypothetical protein